LILIPAWSFCLIGAAQGRGLTLSLPGGLPSPVTLLTLTSILITAYLLNQVFDRETDAKNDKCFYLARGIFQVRTLVIMAMIFLFVAAYAFQEIVPPLQRWMLLGALVLSLLYSLPPVRLCARPLLDMLANAVGYGGAAYIIGFSIYEQSTADAISTSIPYVLLVAATFLHTTILDVEGDRASGKISTTVLIGERRSALLALVFSVLAVVAAVVTRNLLAVIVTGLSLPLAIHALTSGTRSASASQIQATTLIVTGVAIYFWPVYALVLVPLIALARVYYRKRFGITYPGPQRSA
jgi:4-hydroxybenzoate polyprenyltransferase